MEEMKNKLKRLSHVERNEKKLRRKEKLSHVESQCGRFFSTNPTDTQLVQTAHLSGRSAGTVRCESNGSIPMVLDGRSSK